MSKTVRVAAVADIHCSKASRGSLRGLFAEMNEAADVILLCGDLTDYGLPEEARVLAGELAAVDTPVLAVFGNHDFESGQEGEVAQIITDAGVTLLDGEACEVCGVGFAGAKGFGGGFGQWTFTPWGERANKRFVQEAVDEALKLESALARLHGEPRVVLLHYAPTRATVEGESLEIFPFLGTSRLEEPLGRRSLTAVFHGHAHAGKPEGRLTSGAPVYNVSLPVLRRAFADRPSFHLLEVPVAEERPALEEVVEETRA